MTDAQLYLAIGFPVVALVLGMIGNGFLFNALSARMSSLERRFDTLDARMLALETSMNTRFDLIMGRLPTWSAIGRRVTRPKAFHARPASHAKSPGSRMISSLTG